MSTGTREIHLSARQTVRGGMLFRNGDCFMGAFSKGDEYAWREAGEDLIRRAKTAMLSTLSD
jgi:hypothetical protein